jgi:hypothetical protein
VKWWLTQWIDGNSTPGGIDINTPPEVFQRLTTAQALADVDRFAKQFSRPNINHTLTPDKTPWVFVGGSYPGMRAAFMRNRYPNTIFASFASSAPTEARTDMSAYWEPMVRGMRRYGFGNCTRDIISAISYIDKQLDKPSTAAAIKKKFLGLGAENNTNAYFADALSYTFANWQSYGMEGSPYSMRGFCDYMSTYPGTNNVAPVQGWTQKKGAQWVVDRWASWPSFVPMTNRYFNANCSGKQDVKGVCKLDADTRTPAGISWSWQFCTEWGKSSSTRQKIPLTNIYRILPIRQPRSQPSHLQVQLPPTLARHVPRAMAHRQSPPLPRLAQRRANQCPVRWLGHPPLANLLVRR